MWPYSSIVSVSSAKRRFGVHPLYTYLRQPPCYLCWWRWLVVLVALFHLRFHSLSRSLQHLVVDINRNMNAFTTHSSIKNYSDQYYATFAAFQDVFKSAIYTAATICADAFIVRIPYYHRGNLFQKVSLLVQLYRCFIVWSRSYLVIIIPSLLFLADIGTQIILRPLTWQVYSLHWKAIGVLWVYTLSRVPKGGNVFTDNLSIRVRIFYTVTMTLNIICTGMSTAIFIISENGSWYLARIDIPQNLAHSSEPITLFFPSQPPTSSSRTRCHRIWFVVFTPKSSRGLELTSHIYLRRSVHCYLDSSYSPWQF